MAKIKTPRVTGIEQVRKNIAAQIGNIRGRKVMRAMQSALLVGGARIAIYTPIRTTTLINSQYRNITVDGMRITGQVGFSANYAMYVHDPKYKQKFIRVGAKKQFLELSFEEARAEVDRVMAEEMKL